MSGRPGRRPSFADYASGDAQPRSRVSRCGSLLSDGAFSDVAPSECVESGPTPVFGRVLSRLASGHASKAGGGLYVPSVSPCSKRARSVMKEYDEAEVAIYRKFSDEFSDDPVKPFLPEFFGVVEGLDKEGAKSSFLHMGNLLHPFESAKVMDVKLGVRTYVEAELDNPKPRPDLYKKLAEMFPDLVTEEERSSGAITKCRWLSVRDASSSSGRLGYRIDGTAGYVAGDVKHLSDTEETQGAFLSFAEAAGAAGEDADPFSERQGVVAHIAQGMLKEMRLLRSAMEKSSFVRVHEAIGSSLLLVADATGRAGVFWIDFAKTCPVPEGLATTHRRPWKPGNHEDGILLGLDNMIDDWSAVVQSVSHSGYSRRSSIQSLRSMTSTESNGSANGSPRGGSRRATWDLESFAPPPPSLGRVLSRVAAGHASMGGAGILVSENTPRSGRPRSVMKALDEAELLIYSSFKDAYALDPVVPFLPAFEGVIEVDDSDGDCDSRSFVRLSNLLRDFDRDAKVMDVKLGVRTFTENEVENLKQRPDLYERLLQMYPSDVTEAERREGWITKYRWMSVRDECSTISSLGYRIDGSAGYNGGNFSSCGDSVGTTRAFTNFVEAVMCAEGASMSMSPVEGRKGTTTASELADRLLHDLSALRSAMNASAFVARHECIGTSILLVADSSGHARAFWIDFAKTVAIPDHLTVSHRDAWTHGNHEDGVLLGIDNLVGDWTLVANTLRNVSEARHGLPMLLENALEEKDPARLSSKGRIANSFRSASRSTAGQNAKVLHRSRGNWCLSCVPPLCCDVFRRYA